VGPCPLPSIKEHRGSPFSRLLPEQCVSPYFPPLQEHCGSQSCPPSSGVQWVPVLPACRKKQCGSPSFPPCLREHCPSTIGPNPFPPVYRSTVGPCPSRSLREHTAYQSFPHSTGAPWVPVLSARLQEHCASLSFVLFKRAQCVPIVPTISSSPPVHRSTVGPCHSRLSGSTMCPDRSRALEEHCGSPSSPPVYRSTVGPCPSRSLREHRASQSSPHSRGAL
jgi:hypothetical protein